MTDQKHGVFQLRTPEQIEDLLTGFAFYGTGGGGEVSAGRISLTGCLEQGLEMSLMDPDEIRDDGWYCCPFFMGSIAPKTPETLAEMEKLGYSEREYFLEDIMIGAVRTLEQVTGKTMDGIYIAEPGGSNGGCCMAAAYKMGIPVIDGDPAGRAIPEMTQGLPAIREMEYLPAAYFDSWGNQNVTLAARSIPAAERIGKYLSEASYGEMAEAAYLVTGRELKTMLVPRSLSRAYEVGKAINAAKNTGEGGHLGRAAAKASGGIYVGSGVIQTFEPISTDGYYIGTFEVKGQDGHLYKVWFKNENHILWIDGKPAVTSPDLISLIDLDEQTPLLNSHLEDGKNVAIVVSPAYKFYREKKSIASFGPRYFGFDFDYIPYEEISL